MSNFTDILWLIFHIRFHRVHPHPVPDRRQPLPRSEAQGGFKALWIIGLIFVPLLTALIYIVARGRGMAERQRTALQRAKSDTEAYIKGVAGKSPADQIADAKALLDAGTITADEFAKLKAKALA
jgi:hypothetical protein